MKTIAILCVLGCVVASVGAVSDEQVCLSYTEAGKFPVTQWTPSCVNGGVGCDALDITECQFCGFGQYPACTNSAEKQKCLSYTEGGKWPVTQWNTACVNGGVGCNALGVTDCQFCGFGSYPACSGAATTVAPATTTKAATTTTKPATTTAAPSDYQTCFAKAAASGEKVYWDAQCAYQGTIGCNAFGITNCRYCGFGIFSSIICPSKADCGADANQQYQQCQASQKSNPTYSTEFDVACVNGGVGCNAYGFKCCRFCKVGGGDATYPACSIPWSRRLTGDMLFLN